MYENRQGTRPPKSLKYKNFLKEYRSKGRKRSNEKKNPFFFAWTHGLFSTQTLKYFFFIPRVYFIWNTTLTNFYLRKKKIVYFSVGGE